MVRHTTMPVKRSLNTKTELNVIFACSCLLASKLRWVHPRERKVTFPMFFGGKMHIFIPPLLLGEWLKWSCFYLSHILVVGVGIQCCLFWLVGTKGHKCVDKMIRYSGSMCSDEPQGDGWACRRDKAIASQAFCSHECAWWVACTYCALHVKTRLIV